MRGNMVHAVDMRGNFHLPNIHIEVRIGAENAKQFLLLLGPKFVGFGEGTTDVDPDQREPLVFLVHEVVVGGRPDLRRNALGGYTHAGTWSWRMHMHDGTNTD